MLQSSRLPLCLGALPVTELLVDADSLSIHEIKQAINRLKDINREVRTQIFAALGRAKNRRWNNFMQAPDIVFRPVPRYRRDHSREPNDEAIESAMQSLSTHC